MVKRKQHVEPNAPPMAAEDATSKRKKRAEPAAALASAPEDGVPRGESGVVKPGEPNGARSRGRGRGVVSGRGVASASGRGGRGEGAATSRPSALRMLKPRGGRAHTLSVAVPASIVENAQSGELKAVLVGQLARAFTIFGVDEVVVYEDQSAAPPSSDAEGWSRGMAFMTRNLQYLETPQYLRKQLLPMHGDLRWVGLLNPLDAPHHLRKKEWLPYREGVVMGLDSAPAPLDRSKDGRATGCWLNCGLLHPVWVPDHVPEGVRVTVRMDENTRSGDTAYRGVAVAPDEPRSKVGLYWGYQTRLAKSLRAVFEESPFQGGYDLTIGTSERGEAFGLSRLPKFGHLLLVFGGVGGLEEVISDEISGYEAAIDPASLFSRYVNICPNQTSRTIRTEEALLMTLTALGPHLPDR